MRRTATFGDVPHTVDTTDSADRAWRLAASCSSTNAALFFDCEPGSARERRAKRVCGGCPVRDACRDHALARDEDDGIWGGLNPAERRRYRWFYRACGPTGRHLAETKYPRVEQEYR